MARGSEAANPAASRLSARFLGASRRAKLRPFRGSALAAQTIRDSEWMLSGPAETGKTFAGLARVDAECRRVPGSTWVLVRKVRSDMGSTVLATWERISKLRGDAPVPYGGHSPEWYDYSNSSRVYVVGMDRGGKVLSGEYDGIYVNQAEELRIDDWETLSTRVTGRGAKTDTPLLCGDCNPGPASHWILKRAPLRMLHSRHQDNPTLYTDAGELTAQGEKTIAKLDALTGVRRDRLYLGKWVSAEGTVYEFDRARHLAPPGWTPPPQGRRIRSIDFGLTNPFVCQWWWIDHDGSMTLYREIYRTGRIVEDHARDIVRLSQGEVIEATVADHDAEGRATLERHGVPTRPALKSVEVGIQKVQARLQAGRLKVCEGALVERDEDLAERRLPVCTLEEFEMYVWHKGADGKPLKEEPVKLHDHGMDALRYAVMYLDSTTPAREWTHQARRRDVLEFA